VRLGIGQKSKAKKMIGAKMNPACLRHISKRASAALISNI
jgi:hypothetical protein